MLRSSQFRLNTARPTSKSLCLIIAETVALHDSFHGMFTFEISARAELAPVLRAMASMRLSVSIISAYQLVPRWSSPRLIRLNSKSNSPGCPLFVLQKCSRRARVLDTSASHRFSTSIDSWGKEVAGSANVLIVRWKKEPFLILRNIIYYTVHII